MKKEDRIYRHSETSEKALERRLTEKVRALGFLAVKVYDPMNSGMPDRLIVVTGGRTVWVEVKSAGCHPTPLQKSRIKALTELGHLVFVVDSKEKVDEVIDYIRFYRI